MPNLKAAALALACVICWVGSAPARAVDLESTVAFNIAPQPLVTALIEFSRQAQVQVMSAGVDLGKRQAPRLNGTFTIKRALGLLLAGSGLQYSSTGPNTIAITSVSAGLRSEHVGTDGDAAQTLAAAPQASSSTPEQPTAPPARPGSLASQEQAVIEEVIVTAQFRQQDIQDVPISITAFTAEQLEADRLQSLEEIARFAPGFSASTFSNSSPIFAIRGATNTFSQAGASKPVGVFIDGVYVPRYSAASFDLFDLQRIEVLRGPQGTLFGRNVTGGAIQIVTARPSLADRHLQLKAGAGNFDLYEIGGLLSSPFGDTTAGKISFSYRKRDGFAVDRFNGRDLEDLDSLGTRGQFLIAPSESFEILLSADYSSEDNGGRSYSLVSDSTGTNFSDNDGDIRTAELRSPQTYGRDVWGASAQLDWRLGGGTLTSISAYRRSDSRDVYSLGAGDVTLPTVSTQTLRDDTDEPDVLSQELRFVSEESDRLGYVFGLYYYNEDTGRVVGERILGADGAATLTDRVFNVNAETSSYAAYADVTFHFGEKFDLRVGGRYTDERKEVLVDFLDNRVPANSFLVNPDTDFSEFTPRIALSFSATDDVMLFASRTEGFTAGGFNTETNSAPGVLLGFDPETIVAYEAGAKTQWFDRALVANLTLFSQEFTDKQEGFFNPTGPFFSIFNAAEATMEGVELELHWRPTEAFGVSLNYAKLDTEYDRFVIPGGADFSGNRLQTAPESSFAIRFDYRKSLGPGSLLAGVNYSWQDDYFTGASNEPNFLIDSWSLVDATLGYEIAEGTWRIDLWGKNLADEEYVRIRGTIGAIAEYYGPPRTYGLSVTFKQ